MLLLAFLLQIWGLVVGNDRVSWLGSQEGISMQMYNLELLYGVSIDNGFNIDVLSFHNKKHYPDKNYVDLCSIFELPSSIKCQIQSNRTAFANTHNCIVVRKAHRVPATDSVDVVMTIASVPVPAPKQEEWYFIPRTYNLEPHYSISYESSVGVDEFPWGPTISSADTGNKQAKCLIGSPSYFLNSIPFSAAAAERKVNLHHQLPIRFTPYYIELFHKALRNLQWEGSRYAAAHWRRGDQLIMRCPSSDSSIGSGASAITSSNRSNIITKGLVSVLDESINCASAGVFVDTLLQDCCQSSTEVIAADSYNIYVATNEKAAAVIRRMKRLSNGNIKTFVDLKFGKSLSSVDRFVVEVLLLIHADSFHHYGVSAVHLLVQRARMQLHQLDTY